MNTLVWQKVPSVLAGGKSHFFNAWPNGVGNSPKLTVVFAPVARCWWAKIDDKPMQAFFTAEQAKDYLQSGLDNNPASAKVSE